MKKLKKIIASLSVLAVMLSVCPVSASASTLKTSQNKQESNIATTVVISDPETGDVWRWNVPKSDVSINSSTLSTSEASNLKTNSLNEGNNIKKTDISVNVRKYLEETFDSITIQSLRKSSTLEDDITLNTGLTYSSNSSNNTISVYSVFGSTTTEGLYYAADRSVYWRNPGAGLGDIFYPGSNSWSYSTNSTAGNYNSNLPPYSLLECKIRISGMSAYRTVSVMCQIP